MNEKQQGTVDPLFIGMMSLVQRAKQGGEETIPVDDLVRVLDVADRKRIELQVQQQIQLLYEKVGRLELLMAEPRGSRPAPEPSEESPDHAFERARQRRDSRPPASGS